MSIGISKSKISMILKNAGASEEVAKAVARVIHLNNAEIERDIERKIDDAVRYLRK